MAKSKDKANKFYDALKQGLEEIIAHKQGKISLHSEEFEGPKPKPRKKAVSLQRAKSCGTVSGSKI